MSAESLEEQIAKYSNLAYNRGLVGAAGGNISTRYDSHFLITAGGKSLRDITSQDIITVDEKGMVIKAKEGLKPSKETSLHLNIYKNRPDIDSVVHVHPSYCTAFSINKREVPILTASSILKLVRVPLVEYADPGSEKLAELVALCVKNSPQHIKALILEAHGLIAWDKELSNCYDIAELVEETARAAFISEQLKYHK